MALLIGNKNYDYMSDLANPINDISAVETKLKQLGFLGNIHKYDDLSLRGIKVAVSKFTKAVQSEKEKGYKITTLIYYSRHGIGDKNSTYIVPTEYQIVQEEDIAGKKFDLKRLEAKLIRAGSTTNMMKFV